MLHEVGAFEAKNKFGTLLDWVGNGDEVLITRRGKLAARMALDAPGFNRDLAKEAAKGIIELSKTATLGTIKIKDLINAGRKH